MKFPYGIADFYKLITEGYFYVDRTGHVRSMSRAELESLHRHSDSVVALGFERLVWSQVG